MSNSLVGLGAIALIAVGSLRDCASLTRYQNETYECQGANAPFERVTFDKLSIGKQGKIVGPEPTKTTITFVSEDVLIADWGRTQLSIKRDTGALTTIQNGILRTHNCKVMKFRM
ncbi:hypothetical protein [Planktotalea sp.]|uniref:hypothetical protein n=1 Tax=Planktotalea sp. TaxID=2029877 RepID=UPI003F6B55FB